MDIGKLLKNVHSLSEYSTTTQDASEKCKTSKIQLNMSTVLALKKIRSLEIEYFNKCEENGIACVIFERMLCLPPSKTWGVLSKELVNLLQYWLDAIRKHLVRHNSQWWTFLKLLLSFIKDIRQKETSLPNILVEHTAECLLDLATNTRPDAFQKHEILHCFNMYCSESSREIRFAMRNKFGQYFTKLSTYMSSCGHLPTQYSIMETLLRWLLPRQDRTLRLTSAAKWFPSSMYAESDVDIFLERPWVNFFQDARDFLNAHNQRHDYVTSVVCRKFTVGKVVIISGTERQESWLDVNLVSKCVSVLLDPRVLETFGSTNHKSFETLVVTQQNTESAKLHRESPHLLLSIRTTTPPQVLPSNVHLGDDVSCDVTAVLTTHCDVTRLNDALRKLFEDKYELLLDLDKELELSPAKGMENSKQAKDTDEDQRFSHPVEVKRRKHSGYIVKPRQPLSCISPSTASTSSLAQLHEKLAALPRFKYDKEPISVCAPPDLSVVTEVSEADDRQSLNTTFKSKPYGVCYKNLNTLDNRKSQSDPEPSRKPRRGRRLSPIVNEDTTSCLLVATVGSADDSVINDTVERLSKSKDYNPDNIVDLLVQEALQAKHDDKYRSDSGINTGDKKSGDLYENTDTIDATPEIDQVKLKNKKPKVVSSTSDESNTDAINETPCFVNTRRKNKKETKNPAPRNSFDEQVVEEFFSQHFTENKAGEIIISPTLAKKINETSSETSDNFGENFNLINGDIEEDIVPYDFNNIEVLECLNHMVDRVCDEFEKCTEYLNKDEGIAVDLNDTIEEELPLKDIINKIQNIESEAATLKKSKKKPKLKYKITPKRSKAKASRRKNKLELESTSKMSTIIEDQGLEEAAENLNDKENTTTKPEVVQIDEVKQDAPTETTDMETPITRRKRKLYSPNNEGVTSESPQPTENPIVEEPNKIKKTPKITATATCYKEIEKERQRHVRMPRSRKSKVTHKDPPSPRTKKLNDMFDKVKESADGEKVKLADKTFEIDEYNFTSDSEDDFKVKKIEISKRNSTTTIGSFESAVSKRGRAVKRLNYIDNKSSDESNKVKRKVTRKTRSKKRVNAEQNELIDERMRKAKDVLDTSIFVEKTEQIVNIPILDLDKKPEMEVIEEKHDNSEVNQKKKGKKPKVETSESKRSKKVLTKAVVEKVRNFDDDNRTESPLPGLLVEPVIEAEDDTNELSTMVDKFKKIYQEGSENYINETNTTQNLLSDFERRSPRNVDITDDYIEIEDQFQAKQFETKPKKSVSEKKTSSDKKKSSSTLKANIKKERISEAREVNDNVEVINILEETECKSEKSIATIGITGHGELDEEPPSPKLIHERLEPRNLEVEDLDNSMKEYFEKLTKEMNVSDNRNSGSNEENVCKTSVKTKSSGSVKSKSPVISIKRMSSEDISRWLPSRRNSDSDNSYVSSKCNKNNNKEKAVAIIETQTRDDDESQELNTQRQSMRLVFKNSQPVKISDSKEVREDSDSESYQNTPKRKLRAKSKVPESTKKPKSINKPVTKVKTKHTSLISPIKLFDELISNADKQSETTLSDDEDYMKEIIKTVAETKKNTSKPIAKAKSISTVSSQSKISTSTKIEDSRKRRLEEERIDDDAKKRKVEVNNNVDCVSSGVTLSSVDDWFKRIEPQDSRAEMISSSMRHSLQGVLERLDTTLVEIHRNTSKKFVNLFMNAQKHLHAQKEQRQSMYKQLASDILSEVVKIMDAKFADLDERSQELDGNFMKQLKEQASELIREDCKQKRVMVRLLKEDVQAVVDHLDKQAL